MTKTDGKQRTRRKREPLEVNLTLTIRTGPEPENQFHILENRKIPMVGSVFEYRNRIQRFFVSTLLRVATSSPAVMREIAPGLATLARRANPAGRSPGARTK